MVSKKIKIVLYFFLSVAVLAIIGYFFGGKLVQQDRLHMRNELNLKDARLRELGVNVCIIQPKEKKSNRLFVMLDFWETEESQILKRMDKIKKIISDYAKMEGVHSPIISYIDSDGYELDDVLRAQADVGVDESEAEYYSVVHRYTNDLEQKLRESFDREMPSKDYRIKVIADAEYDVTLDTYGAKKLYFFARFRNANTRELQAVRIAYKKISGFKVARGDKIYFYNQKSIDFTLVSVMKRLMDRQKNTDNRERVVLFTPIQGKFQDVPVNRPVTPSSARPTKTPVPLPTYATPTRKPISTPTPTPVSTPTTGPTATPPATPSPDETTNGGILGPPVPGQTPAIP